MYLSRKRDAHFFKVRRTTSDPKNANRNRKRKIRSVGIVDEKIFEFAELDELAKNGEYASLLDKDEKLSADHITDYIRLVNDEEFEKYDASGDNMKLVLGPQFHQKYRKLVELEQNPADRAMYVTDFLSKSF